MATKRNNSKTQDLTLIAIFSALVIVLQFFAGNFSAAVGVNFTLALTPIILCGAIVGIKGGIITGAVFGAMTVINAVISRDLWTAALLQLNAKSAILTVLVCFTKAIAAGLVSALVYKALAKKNDLIAVFISSALAPIVNTSLFILLALTVLSGAFTSLSTSGNAMFVGSETDIINYLVIGCAGVNFLFEFVINLILAPVIHRVTKAVSKGKI